MPKAKKQNTKATLKISENLPNDEHNRDSSQINFFNQNSIKTAQEIYTKYKYKAFEKISLRNVLITNKRHYVKFLSK